MTRHARFTSADGLGATVSRCIRWRMTGPMVVGHGLIVVLCLLVLGIGESWQQKMFYLALGAFATWAGYRAATLGVITVRERGLVVRTARGKQCLRWTDVDRVELSTATSDAGVGGRTLVVRLRDGRTIRANGFWESKRWAGVPQQSNLGRLVARLNAARPLV